MQKECIKQKVDRKRYFTCQACHSLQNNILLCKYCLSVNCKQCRNSHHCPIFEGSSQTTSRLLNFNKNDLQISKKRRRDSLTRPMANIQDQKIQMVKGQPLISCNRCSVNEASDQCKTCKIQYYCNSCFNHIHSSPKFQKHLHAPIQQIRQVQGKYQESFVKLSLGQYNLSQQQSKMNFSMNQPSKAVLAIQSNLNIMRNRLQYNKNANICQFSEAIHNVGVTFETLTKIIQQKKQQIMLFLAQSQKSRLKYYEDMEIQLLNEEYCLKNIKIMRENEKWLKQFDKKSGISEQFCINMMKKIESDSLDIIDVRFQDINKQCHQFQLKLHKTTFKKSLYQLNKIKDISLGNSSTQDTPRCPIKSKKQQKVSKKSANHSQCKSLSKFHPIAFDLNSPKRIIVDSMRASNRNSNIIIESTVIKNCKEKINKQTKLDKISNNINLNTGFKNRTENDDSPNRQPQVDTLVSPSIKRSKRNSQNNPYQIVGNYGKYVEKANKRSKQMKADIIQLTKFAYLSSVTDSVNKR